MTRARRSWGSIRKLPSKRYQATYTGPDLARYVGPDTFATRVAAETWLLKVRQTIDDGSWASLLAHADDPEPTPPPTLRAYAEEWLDGRDLKPRTRLHYRQILDSRILPEFGGRVLTEVTPAEVRAWHAALDPTKPTIRAHSYALLRTIYSTAVADELVEANPCRVKAAGSVTRAKTIRPATLAELEVIVREMPERLRPMVLLAAWCALRFGELAELRRADVDLRHGVLHVRRGVVRLGAEVIVGTPKSAAGVRNVAVPPHLLPVLKEHLGARVERGADALLFPATDGRQLSPNSLYWWFFRARHAAGRDDLRFHDLRHTGAVLAASTGATLAELMARLGHSTPAAAMRYQHAAQDRDRVIAEALSALVRAESASSG